MSDWKNQLTGYVNKDRNSERQYLTITNVSEEDVVIKAGEKLFMNRTPNDILAKYPKMPHYKKDVPPVLSQDNVSEEVANNIPF